MITSISKKQEALIPEYLDKWLSMPLKEFDDQTVINTVHRMYADMREQQPLVLFFDSPLACELVGNFIKPLLESNSQLRNQLGSQLDSQLNSQLGSQLGSQLNSHLDSQLGSQLDSQLNSQLGNQLGSQLHSQLGNQLGSQLGSQLRNQLYNQKLTWFGLVNVWWCAWAGRYDYAESIGVRFDEHKFKLFLDFNSQVIYSVPLKGVCIVSRKPTKIKWKNKQLHAEGEKAVEFRDGWGWCCYSGVELPEYIGLVKPNEWKAKWVLESNRADLRALLVSGMGPKRFIEGIGAKCVDHFYSPVNHPVKGEITQIVELYEPDFSKFNPANKFKILHLTCPSTELDHYHWVPPQIETARDAYIWFWKGRTPEQMTVEA